MEADALSPERFVQELYGTSPPDYWVEFLLLQYQPTQDNPNAKKILVHYYQVRDVVNPGQFEATLNYLRFKNSHLWNIHPSVNPRKIKRDRGRGRNDDIDGYVALWVDIDFHDNEPAVRAQWEATRKEFAGQGLDPSVVIESGHGIHAYWLLDRPYPVAEARPCLAGLQDAAKSDPVNDPARVLRMPGTANVKDPKAIVKCDVTGASWKRFPLESFKDYEIDPGKTEEEVEQDSAPPPPHSHDPQIEKILAEGSGEGSRNNDAAKVAGYFFGKGYNLDQAVEAMTAWNEKNTPPLSSPELLSVIQSIHKKEKAKPPKKPSKKRDRGPGMKYFEGREFLPRRLADEICSKVPLIATPEGDDGLGVDLFVYRDGSFRAGGAAKVVDLCQELLGDESKAPRVATVCDSVRISQRTPYDKLNLSAGTLINVKNGMLDWRKGEIIPHDTKYLSTIQINAEWDPAATCPQVQKFFETVLPEDEGKIVEEYLGYLLLPDTSFGKCLVAIGEGGNGKSTFLKLLTHFIGKENISTLSLHQIAEERFTSASLFGKLANFYDELEHKALENTGIFKQIVTGDPIKAEEKGKAPFSFKPFCRLVFATNEMPRSKDRSQAYFDRFIFVKFPNRIRGTSIAVRDYDLVLAKVPGAMSYLLSRAVDGLRRLQDQGKFSISKTSLEAIEEYQRDCNSAYDFVQECCTFDDPTGFIPKADMYSGYKNWSEENGRRPMSAREFARTLGGLNVKEARTMTARGWSGIAWKNGLPLSSSSKELGLFQDGLNNREPRIDF